jgi:hypothetical protein
MQFFSISYFQKWAGEIAPILVKMRVVCVAAYSKNQSLQHPSSYSISDRAANDAFEPKNDVKSKQPNSIKLMIGHQR